MKIQLTIDLLPLIETNYKEQHSAIYYADKISMSPRNLSKKVSENLNTTVKDIINKKIVAEASRLINLKLPISEIARQLGFKEPQHFSHFYKLHTGVAPSVDRN